MTRIPSMNKSFFFCIICIALMGAWTGCQKKSNELPEHEKERIAREKERAKAREVMEAERAKMQKESAKKEKKAEDPYGESRWPADVAEGYRVLFRSGIAVMPDAARHLALLGLPADPALRRIITHPRLPVKKRAFTSLMMAQLYTFRPADLIKLLEASDMPYVQRAAIETLGMLGVQEGKDALAKMKTALETGGEQRRKEELEANRKRRGAKGPVPGGAHAHGHGHGDEDDGEPDPSAAPGGANPYAPLIAFIEQALARKQTLGLSGEQLKALDTVLQSQTAAQLKAAIQGITDLSFEPGMAMILGSPVSSELVKVGTALRLIELARDKSGKVLSYCSPGYPPMLRMAAARFVLERANPKEVDQLTRIAANEQDPMSQALQELLIKKPVLPKIPSP